jgi:MFS family permease
MATGAVMLGIFFWHESRTADPMIVLDLFRLRSLRTANLASMTGAATLFGILLVLPFYMAAVLGYGPIGLALGIMPVALAYTVVSPVAGRGINRFGADRVAMAGYALAAAGTLGLAAAAAAESYAAILPGILGLSAGLALATSPITVVAISEVPRERLGVASSFPNISRYTGGAFGAAILGSVLTASVTVDDLTDVSPGVADQVVDGFTNACLIAVVFLALAFVAAWRMPGSPGMGRGEPSA